MNRSSRHRGTEDANRRDVWDAASALLLLSAAAAGQAQATGSDSELIAACASAAAADEQSLALVDPVNDVPSNDPRCKAAWAQSHEVMRGHFMNVKRATELPARSPEGLRAKAELALRDVLPSQEDNPTPLVISLLQDMLGRAV